jgi:hypothetical protein
MAFDDRDYVKARHRKLLEQELKDVHYDPKLFRTKVPRKLAAGKSRVPDLTALLRTKGWQVLGWLLTLHLLFRWLA